MRTVIRYFIILICCSALVGCAGGVRVRKGDTLYSIARKKEVPVRALIEVNELKPPYVIKPGDFLALPKTVIHRVRKGDTLYSIARRYDVSVHALAKSNKIAEPYTIKAGQKLTVSSWSENVEGSGGVAQKRTAIAKPVKRPNAFKGEAKIPKAQTKKKFGWPASGRVISEFGSGSAGNDGINIAGKIGDPIKAADAGTVVYAGNELKGYGNLVLVRHKEGWITAYAHNNKLNVVKGQTVVKGQKIAEMGKTGSVKSPQVHFEVRYKSKVVNPKRYLAGR
jgi:murein DD-endopeptidase MepM/ murein hydrolase activator NlpD